MSDQTTNVIEAGNLIKGLMTGEEAAPIETVPTEVTEEPIETVETEETQGILTEEAESPEIEESYEAEELSESSETQENSKEPYYSVIVDGTDLSVNLEELIQGYQRNADYPWIF